MIKITVEIKIGRRIPKAWYRRLGSTIGGLFTFQENIWIVIKNALSLAKKQANRPETGVTFVMTHEMESEDLHYQIEWIKIIIRASKEKELEEYNEFMQLYGPLKNIFKKGEMEKSDALSKMLKTKMLTPLQLEKAYKEGYGCSKDKTMSAILLEMGIVSYAELTDDYSLRPV